MLRRLLAILISREVVTLVGVILLSVLIWLIGPLVAVADFYPFESTLVRFIAIILLFVLWAVFLLLRQRKSKKTDAALVEGLVAGEAGAAQRSTDSEELPQLRERFEEALELLKRSKLGGEVGRQYLYQLPWYVLIGPPGAGKTTALVNSELHFPLADHLGKNAVRGVGGTRNCDWWFTDDAVLIDTAGRYTTQDSDQLADATAWTAFLDLLKKTRPRQPINGVLLAISLEDLSTLPEAERRKHAQAVKKRIAEIRDVLGLRVPVYALFTKADLIAGFVEFFDDLGREERQQVWGATLPLEEGGKGGQAIAAFGAEFDLLVARLNERLLARLQQETDLRRRALIYGFPQQFVSLKSAVGDFLDAIFRPSRLEEVPILRGFYFTSGTQFGTPVDRLVGAMASSFGLSRQALAAFSGAGRSYFLTRLLKNVVFAEAGMVSTNRRVERRNLWIRGAAYAAAAIVLFGMGALWLNSYFGNLRLIESTAVAVAKYNEQIKGLQVTSFDDADLRSVLVPLATLRSLPTGYDERDKPVPLALDFGLYQGGKLSVATLDAYRRGLNGILLPRLIGQLEREMRGNLANPEYLYEALKVYLMLARQGPLDAPLVKDWMALGWQRAFPLLGDQPVRDALAAHLAALLEAPLADVPPDPALIKQIRQVVSQVPLAQRAYRIIVRSAAAEALPAWSALSVGGPQTADAFVRRSKKPLSEGVAGIYTYDGFQRVFLPQLKGITSEVAKESWVLGEDSAAKATPGELAKLEKDVLDLYLTEYAAQWDAQLADLEIVPFRSLEHTIEVLNILSGPASPLRNLMKGIAHETTLTAPLVTQGVADTGGAALNAKAMAAAEAKKAAQASPTGSRLSQILGASGPAAPLPGQSVDDHYKALHALVTGSPSELDQIIGILQQLKDQLLKAGPVPGQSQAAVGGTFFERVAGESAVRLKSELVRLPSPLRDWMDAVLKGNSAVSVGGARERMNAEWKSNVLPFCRQALDNRYPLFKQSAADVPLDDFARLFAPGGLIDGFFDTQLRPFVDTAQRPWRWQRVEDTDLGIPAAVLVQFQYAAAIRDALFGGGKTPRVSFEITPVSLDAGAGQVTLTVDGQPVVYQHGPPVPKQLQWPGSGGPMEARLAFTDAAGGKGAVAPGSLTLRGPWAFFRLLDRATVTRSQQPDHFTIAFNINGHSAAFEVAANSVVNPFMLDALGRFRCPAGL